MKRITLVVVALAGVLVGTEVPAQGISLERKTEAKNPFGSPAPEKVAPKDPFESNGSAVTLPPPPIPPLEATGTAFIDKGSTTSPKKKATSGQETTKATSPQAEQGDPAVAQPSVEASAQTNQATSSPPVVRQPPCPILIESGDRYDVLSVGGQIIVRLGLVDSRSCVLAVESKVPWLSVSAFDGKTLILEFTANTRRRNREGQVVLANARESRTLQVSQAPCQDPHCEGALILETPTSLEGKPSETTIPKGDSVESR